MSVKVIVLDIDGTLVNNDKKISQATKDALLKVQEKENVKLILASGRPTRGLSYLAQELEMDKHHGFLISFNGSKIIDAQSQEVLYNQTMDVKTAKEVLNHLKKFDVRPIIDKDDYMYVNNVYDCYIPFNGEIVNIIEIESREARYKLCEVDDLAEFLDYPLNKILTAAPYDYLKDNYQAMYEPFKDRLNGMFTSEVFFEFTDKNVDKAQALEKVLLPLGYKKEEIMAIGDGQNDKSMIEFAGHGIAMGNAIDEVKEIADYISLSNEEDGVAHVVYKYFPNLKEE